MRKTKYHIKKKIMPLLLAVAMAGTATPIYVAHPAIVKAGCPLVAGCGYGL